MSATLNTAKRTKSTLNMSTTNPRNARSMRLPTAPASSRVRVSLPRGCLNSSRHRARASRTDITRESSASAQVFCT